MQQPPEPGATIPPSDPPAAPPPADTCTVGRTSPPAPTRESTLTVDGRPPADEPVLWKERLYPNFGVWVIVVGLSLIPAVIFAPIDMTTGVLASVLTLIILVTMMMTSTPTILVTRSALQVGRAQIDRIYIGKVEAFINEEATAQRGTGLHGLTHLCIRGWIDAVVKIEITDKEDPAPYWLVSSRHPDELAELLTTRLDQQRPGRQRPEENR